MYHDWLEQINPSLNRDNGFELANTIHIFLRLMKYGEANEILYF